ncbi:hypothetical protein A4R26_23370 [Niastella populi]|uniref:Alpha 1,4-glycosyltransferase domain-containing protein n=1 Tax=Niastella populi TaxID=550983 RepID=A0A1V9FHV9_9BACT|nr:hypothetical protein A4R26_23370 [Niastella populi]
MGFESGNTGSADFWVNNAIMGSTPNHPFVNECEQNLLSRFDGTEQANLSSPHLVTNILKTQYGLKEYGRQLLNNIMLYEKEVFYPIPVDKVYLLKEVNTYPSHTIAVHLWGRTWFTNEMLLEEMDNLRKYTHELNEYIEKMTRDLNRSREELEMANTRLTEVQNENATFKFLATDFLKKIEAGQLTLEKSSTETNGKINELMNDIKAISKQQEVMNQKLDALKLAYKK